MKKIFLSDNSGRFFDLETAKAFNQRKYDSPLSKTMFMTSSGKWIEQVSLPGNPKNANVDSFNEISEKDAARWFLKQGFPDNEIPAELTEAIKEFQL